MLSFSYMKSEKTNNCAIISVIFMKREARTCDVIQKLVYLFFQNCNYKHK